MSSITKLSEHIDFTDPRVEINMSSDKGQVTLDAPGEVLHGNVQATVQNELGTPSARRPRVIGGETSIEKVYHEGSTLEATINKKYPGKVVHLAVEHTASHPEAKAKDIDPGWLNP